VVSDTKYYRPAEIFDLLANPSKAREKLGWQYEYKFEDLVREMVQGDLNGFQKPKF
jgi:GDPmannose 4,6-dehydratase